MCRSTERQGRSASSRAGFTLVELMVALTILGLLSLGITRFLNDTNILMLSVTGKLEINAEIRDFTESMSGEARAANSFLLYRSFYPVTTEDPLGDLRDPPAGTDYTDYRRRVGESGDLVVFIYERVDPNPMDNLVPIERIVGYYRSAPDTASGEAPVRRFEVNVAEADKYELVEKLIPSSALAANHETVVSLAEGLANGMLFYNFNDRSVLVNAKIVHQNIAKQITGTYNFTVSPRG
jgi:prepilin-type N-terminal cleavage/methylation domain-containing protein